MRRKKNQRPWVVILYDMIYDYIKLIFLRSELYVQLSEFV